jgi:hypothetical protein
MDEKGLPVDISDSSGYYCHLSQDTYCGERRKGQVLGMNNMTQLDWQV